MIGVNRSKFVGGILKPPKPQPEYEILSRWKGSAENPLVSIQCITYNHASYIEDALNGFLMQITTFPFEIWIHDDASTDGTREIVERYKAAYPKIIKTILQTENQYSKGTRAKYFLRGKCNGRYYALCEGDDFWVSDNKLTAQVEALEKFPEAHIALHPAYEWDVENNRVTEAYYKGHETKCLDVIDAVSSLGQFSPTSSYLFKADEMEAMPDWFFEAKDLPFGDYFRETILGRSGLVYMPSFFSVYRRNSPGSYTSRTNYLSTGEFIGRLNSVLCYTNKLFDVEEIPDRSILIRRRNIYLDYLGIALNRNSLELYSGVISVADYNEESVPWCFSVASGRGNIFNMYCVAYKIIKPSVVNLKKFKSRVSYFIN